MRQIYGPQLVKPETLLEPLYEEYNFAVYSGITIPVREFTMLAAYRMSAGTTFIAGNNEHAALTGMPVVGGIINNRERSILTVTDATPQMIMLDKRWATGHPKMWDLDIMGDADDLFLTVLYWYPSFSTTHGGF